MKNRLGILCLLSIQSFHFLLFLHLIQSTKTNPRSQGELPHVARKRLVTTNRFRQSVYWEPGPRNRAVFLPVDEEKRKTDLQVQRLHQDMQPAV